jgi:hypothetical protein
VEEYLFDMMSTNQPVGTDKSCVLPYLTLKYYDNGWFDYTNLQAKLMDGDPRKHILNWMESKTDINDITKSYSEFAKKVFYIFQKRWKFFHDTIEMDGFVEDLKPISDYEGYMSEIAMDYCLMAMFFEVKNIYPLHTQLLTIWNSCLSYSYLKEQFPDYLYNDCDVMEVQATNKDFIFIIPLYRDDHYHTIVRRWIDNKIYFFYNDSNYKSERTVSQKSTTFVPFEVFGFLMNSPLWPVDTTVYWIRLPSKEQEEDECGFRTLLHSYILVLSKNPLYSLIPLNYFGTKTVGKKHSFYKRCHVLFANG